MRGGIDQVVGKVGGSGGVVAVGSNCDVHSYWVVRRASELQRMVMEVQARSSHLDKKLRGRVRYLVIILSW